MSEDELNKPKPKKKASLWYLLQLEQIDVNFKRANDLYGIPLVELGFVPTSGHICLSVKMKKGEL